MVHINKKLAKLNSFKPYKLPTSRQLFEKYGYSLVKDQHPDNTDPYHFGVPSNPQGIVPNSGVVALGGRLAESYRPVQSDPPKQEDQQQQEPAPAQE